MGNVSIRINKVLKELNVSLDRAVGLLNEKGYEVEARPTSKISQEMYDALLDEFQSDKSKRIASDKLGKEKEKEKEEILQEIVVKKDEVIKAKAETVAGLKIVGNVEVDKKEETPAKSEEPKEEKTPKKEASKKKESSKENQPEKEEKTPEKKEVEATPKEDDVIRFKPTQLAGPVLTGEKIDLKQFEKKPKKIEPKADAAAKKRKRIVKVGDPKKGGGDRFKKGGARGGNRNNTLNKKVELTEEEIQKQVRETLEKLQGRGSKSKGAKYRKEKRDVHKQRTEEDIEQREQENKILKVTEFVTLGEMASLMDVSSNEVIGTCMSLGMMVSMNQRLDAEALTVVADEFGFEIEFITTDIEESVQEDEDKEEDLSHRAPIVTVMGHVDHGKTSLLDYIRKANVIAGESGGITQHMKAYSVELENNKKITFMDTPGHQAFTSMRARGTQITDVAVIVIAADDDIMPQTKEAISHAQTAGVPIVFAINKIDRPEANPEKIKEGLAGMNLLVEDWGGKIQSQEISAKEGTGVDELLEKILLEAELLDLKANPDRKANGVVVDTQLDKGKGYVATLMIQRGTLSIGDYILAGQHTGKIKAMTDERDHSVSQAGPSTPVNVLGLSGAPMAGDKFLTFEDEKEAKQIADKRIQLQREQSTRTQKHVTLDEIGKRIAQGSFKEMNVIVKGDVGGSIEALTDSIQKLTNEEIQVNIVHKGVGTITESDVLLASASEARIIGFNVKPTENARGLAEKEMVEIQTYSIIFDAINDVRDAMEDLLSPDINIEYMGKAEVRQLFKVTKLGTIAGCMVMDGKIYSTSKVNVIRDGETIHTGTLSSLKRFKDDVKEVSKGYDCGLQVKGFDDILENDVIEAFKEVKTRKKLKG